MATEQCNRCNKLIQASEAVECDICDAIICNQCAVGGVCKEHSKRPVSTPVGYMIIKNGQVVQDVRYKSNDQLL